MHDEMHTFDFNVIHILKSIVGMQESFAIEGG